MDRAIVPFEIKAVSEDSPEGEFQGYGSTFDNIDLGRDVVLAGAFKSSLEKFSDKKQLPLLPWYHDMSTPIGDWLELREDEKGLYGRGKLWVQNGRSTEKAIMAHNMIMGTGPKGLSIGFQ